MEKAKKVHGRSHLDHFNNSNKNQEMVIGLVVMVTFKKTKNEEIRVAMPTSNYRNTNLKESWEGMYTFTIKNVNSEEHFPQKF